MVNSLAQPEFLPDQVVRNREKCEQRDTPEHVALANELKLLGKFGSQIALGNEVEILLRQV